MTKPEDADQQHIDALVAQGESADAARRILDAVKCAASSSGGEDPGEQFDRAWEDLLISRRTEAVMGKKGL